MEKKKKAIMYGLFISFLVFGNLFLFFLGCIPQKIGLTTWHETFCDVDKLDNGNYMITGFPIAGLPVMGSINEDPTTNRVYIVNQEGNIIWEHFGLYFPHEAEMIVSGATNQSAIIVANAAKGGIDQINYENHITEWQWLPEMLNWTELIPEWDEESYAMNSIDEYGHYIVNDVDFINGSLFGDIFDSLLISIKRLNIILLVNYTAEMTEYQAGDYYGNASNVYWYYGIEENQLYQQHNPDMLPNGNIVIADSENKRVIEINKTTKNIIWEMSQTQGFSFSGPKDADYIPTTDTYIITDTGNNRILEITKSGEVLWSFSNVDLIQPYESDLLDNGNVLISGAASGVLMEITRETNPEVVWKLDMNTLYKNPTGESHINYIVWTFRFNLIIVCTLIGLKLGYQIKIRKDTQKRKNPFYFLKISLRIMCFVGAILGIIFTRALFAELATILMHIALGISPEIPSLGN